MTDYTGLKRLIDAAKPWVGTYAEWPETKGGKAMKNFCAAFKPKDAGALITENERLVAWREGLLKERAAHIRQRDQLKAEIEALRKLAPSKEIIWCACGDGYPVNSYGAGFMDANNGVCANCDAAMGKGEQS